MRAVQACEPQTLIVGSADDSGLITQCLLALADRFELPPSVAIAHRTGPGAEPSAGMVSNVLAFVEGPGPAAPPGEVLRASEATEWLATRGRLDRRLAASTVVAVTVDRSHPAPIDRAVRLAVTTLIDWGHEVVCRRA